MASNRIKDVYRLISPTKMLWQDTNKKLIELFNNNVNLSNINNHNSFSLNNSRVNINNNRDNISHSINHSNNSINHSNNNSFRHKAINSTAMETLILQFLEPIHLGNMKKN